MTFVLPTLNYHGFQHCCPSPVPKAASRTWPGVEGELKKILPFAKVLMIYTYLGLGSSRFSTKKTLLVGGLEHQLYDFPYIGNNNPK